MVKKDLDKSKELDTFIPKEINGSIKYEITKGKDVEASVNALGGEFDPFKARVLEHPTSNIDTLVHLLKSCLGSGILSMPAAFKNAGLLVGLFGTIIVSLVVTHCSYVLVICAHELYRRSGKSQMTFADVAEEACLRGPKWAKKFGRFARIVVDVGIFTAYYGTCSAYSVIVAKSIGLICLQHMGEEPDTRKIIAILLIPCLLLCYVPNLKKLAIVSMLANLSMGVGLAITIYYLMVDLPDFKKSEWSAPIEGFPLFFSTAVFALEGIGVVMPLENNMKKPQNFVGICGILNSGMTFVTFIYILVGFFGYLRYGDKTEDAITLNLPKDKMPAQAVQVLIAIALLLTFALQFFVCLDIVWSNVKDRLKSKPLLYNYILRTCMVVVAICIAIALPQILPFVSLIGALCFSIIGLMLPVFIEILTFWHKGFGRFNWKIFKNSFIIIIAILALVFGTNSAIADIKKLYTTTINNSTVLESSTFGKGNLSMLVNATTYDVFDTTSVGTTTIGMDLLNIINNSTSAV